MKDFITVVGLDVHKDSIEVVIAKAYGKQEVRHYGKIGGDMASLDKMVKKLVSRGNRLNFVYEAGPCGYEIYRRLTKQGYDCAVVAPSMIPKRSGNRIKNDRRDAEALARLYRAGELTTVHVQHEDDEEMRDLVRGRQDAVKGLRTARVSRQLLKRQEGISQSICDIAWKAQVRLCGRFRRLLSRGKSRNMVVTAIARN